MPQRKRGKRNATCGGMRYLALILVTLTALVGALVTPPLGKTKIHEASAQAQAVPLVVVLHGDREDSSDSKRRWKAAVEARGWELLAVDCPKGLGCEGGCWYRWDGDPKWLRDQVREVAQKKRIDTRRIYLVGWSGGATYIGKHIQAWPQMFAALVIHGGGVPPREADSCPDRRFPAYFLVGDKNPAHGGAKRLRSYFDKCGQEVQWDLLPGANHPKEDEALTPEKAEQILRWLDERRRDNVVS
jgi:poly(3-hydroxybutyrate) depolymerase